MPQTKFIFKSLIKTYQIMTTTQTRFESSKEFKPIWDSLPVGTKAWKVKTFDGNTGNCVGIEYTLDSEDLADMKEVADGYFTETWKLTK